MSRLTTMNNETTNQTMTNKLEYKGITLFVTNKGQIFNTDGRELK
jgi:hypothetical protein